MALRAFQFFSVLIVIALLGCSKPTFKDVKKAKLEERYAQAYAICGEIITKHGETFTIPQVAKFKSGKEFGDWLGDLTANYVTFSLTKPRTTDCEECFAEMKSLEKQLTRRENFLLLEKSTPLQEQQFLGIIQNLYFSDQKLFPASAVTSAKQAYATNLSIVVIGGDYASHVDGVMYSASRNIAFPFSLEYDLAFGGCVLFMPPGEWVAVCRIVPELSDPKSKDYLALNDLRGRYAASYFTNPATPHQITFRFSH